MAVQTQIQTRRGTAASWTSTNPTLGAGEIGFESDTGKIKIGTGSTAWNALAYTASSTAVTYLFNATAAQTTFSGTDANGLTLAYTVGSEQVYLNGVLQVRGSDYTATNGTSIVLTSGALVSDVLNVIAFSALALSDTYTQAQADAKFFQTANEFSAGKNKIINGDFNINQRAFTTSTTNGAYMFDRWFNAIAGDGTSTFSAQTFTPGAAPVAGYESTNFIQIVTASQTTSAVSTILGQRIESGKTFAGQTVTASFWAKANSGTPKIAVEFTQSFGTGGSPSTSVITYAGSVTLSTSWARYSVSVAIPSVSGKTFGTTQDGNLRLNLWVSAGSDFNARTGSLGIQSNTFQVWGVQVEAGSIATPFQTATGTIQGELAACQRYYWRTTPGTANGSIGSTGVGKSTTVITNLVNNPVSMRITPTSVDFSSIVAYDGVTGITVTAITLGTTVSASPLLSSIDSTGTGITQFRPYYLYTNSTTGFLGFNAEL